jgi:hypothetical protein
MTALMADAATPPSVAPAGYAAIAGYIGRDGRTPHVWTRAEWDRFTGMRKLPIWVPGPGASASADAWAIAEELYKLGVKRGNAVAVDLEEAVAPGYLRQLHNRLNFLDYVLWVYGQASTIFGNPPCDGYWVADWTGNPHEYPHDNVRATQYTSGNAYDSSEVREFAYIHHLKDW